MRHTRKQNNRPIILYVDEWDKNTLNCQIVKVKINLELNEVEKLWKKRKSDLYVFYLLQYVSL